MKLIFKGTLTDELRQSGERQHIKDGLRWWAVAVLGLFVSGGLLLKRLAPKEWNIGSGENLKNAAGFIAHWVELAAIGLIFIGVLAALYTAFVVSVRTVKDSRWMPSPDFPTLFKKEEIAGSLTLWLLLGLEFAIAADIIKTAVSPISPTEWNQIGALAAIVGIRAFLGYMLEIDLEKVAASKRKQGQVDGEQAPIKPAA